MSVDSAVMVHTFPRDDLVQIEGVATIEGVAKTGEVAEIVEKRLVSELV
jgi:hypothetical protein